MAAEVSGSFDVVASGSLLFSPSSVVVMSALSCSDIDVVSSEDSIFYLSFHHVNLKLEIYEAVSVNSVWAVDVSSSTGHLSGI